MAGHFHVHGGTIFFCPFPFALPHFQPRAHIFGHSAPVSGYLSSTADSKQYKQLCCTMEIAGQLGSDSSLDNGDCGVGSMLGWLRCCQEKWKKQASGSCGTSRNEAEALVLMPKQRGRSYGFGSRCVAEG
jgi:hypothetical protein